MLLMKASFAYFRRLSQPGRIALHNRQKISPPAPIRPHKCLKSARLPPDGLHLLPSNSPGESTEVGFTFIRHSTHNTTRVCCPTNSPRTPVRINTYHRDITTMRLSGMRSGAILGFFRLGAVVFITREPKEVVCRKTKADEYTPKKPGALVPHVEKLNHEVKH